MHPVLYIGVFTLLFSFIFGFPIGTLMGLIIGIGVRKRNINSRKIFESVK
ncbi:putative membrane protein [Staphylococcus epidermidis FRI909]|nr:putative membrane protein [Staphylococcus epidermidis FRI909]